MTDMAVDPLTNDLQLAGGKPVVLTGAQLKGQRIRNRLLTVRGEWFLDKEYGLDYRGVVWVKSTPRSQLAAHVKGEITKASDPGDRITAFETTYDGVTRAFGIEATVQQQDGVTVSVSV